jgi:hypothetical protein
MIPWTAPHELAASLIVSWMIAIARDSSTVIARSVAAAHGPLMAGPRVADRTAYVELHILSNYK